MCRYDLTKNKVKQPAVFTSVFAGTGEFSDFTCPFLNDSHYLFNDPGASVCFFEIIHQDLRLWNDAAGHIFQCF